MITRGPLPSRLFKYFPRKHLDAVASGELLFRNLAYFRRAEDAARGDVEEGMHIDAPSRVVSISDPTTGAIRSMGHFRFHNEVDQERVFAFCLSSELRKDLFASFGDTAIEILDVEGFLRRLALAVGKSPVFSKQGAIVGPVEYYDPRLPASGDVKDPTQIPFFKPRQFESQREFRIVVSHRNGLVLRQSIVRGGHSLASEAAEQADLSKTFRVNGLSGIIRVIREDEL